eukprot:scaffold74108_cov20-Tisochrysis_lutea.AAC.2
MEHAIAYSTEVVKKRALLDGPPPGYDFRATTSAATRAVVQQEYPQLLPLVDRGAGLVASPCCYHLSHCDHALGLACYKLDHFNYALMLQECAFLLLLVDRGVWLVAGACLLPPALPLPPCPHAARGLLPPALPLQPRLDVARVCIVAAASGRQWVPCGGLTTACTAVACAGVLVLWQRSSGYMERREDGYREPERVFIVATAHVSSQSAADVDQVIQVCPAQKTGLSLCSL